MKDKFKRLISVIIVLNIVISNLCVSIVFGADEAAYNDIASNTVEISSAEELFEFADRVNNGENSLNGVLMADIVINEGIINSESTGLKYWTPIGDSSNKYTGVFDGQGHIVSGLFYKVNNGYDAGLFGFTDSGAEIKNLGIVNSYIEENYYVGGVCGRNYGKITNCYNTGTISGKSDTGGVCGYNHGTVSGSYNTGTISGESVVGGVCGYNYETIINCYNMGEINGSDNYTGGVSGRNHPGTIINCYNTGKVSCDGEFTGGVCGRNYRTINSYYLAGTADIGTETGTESEAVEKTAEEFASGQVCWLLNDSVSGGESWYQTLGEDEFPVTDSSHSKVYAAGTKYCPDYVEVISYNNEGGDIDIVSEEHSYNEDYLCIYCGKRQEAVYNESEDYYEISSYGQLLWFSDYVNSGNTSANAVLVNDISANEGIITEESVDVNIWTPIGNSSNKYNGIFDGQGHTIDGLFIDGGRSYNGVFGNIGSDSEIKNLGVENSYMYGNSYNGGICGYNSGGKIINCYNNGKVRGRVYTAGICGYNDQGTIMNCYNTGELTGITYGASGICNYSYNGIIKNCYYIKGGPDSGSVVGSENGTFEKTAEEFASGQVCYLLNNSVSGGDTWYQTLGEDEAPVLDTSHGKLNLGGVQYCPDYIENYGYNNEGRDMVIISEEHSYSDKDFCIYCGKMREAEYNEKDNCYEISSYGQLLWFAEYVNSGHTSANAVLTDDITANEGIMSEESVGVNVWTPIGNSSYTYKGTFDGQGYTISGLYFNDIDEDYTGLFGYIGSGAEIKNTGIINGYINGNQQTGGICGYNYYGTITNCYNKGIVNSNSNTGGICGYNYRGTITNCYSAGAVNGENYAGGICGYNYSGTITNCYYMEGLSDKGIGGSYQTNNSDTAEKTEEEFAGGQVCYLLNESVSGGEIWYQTLGTDEMPVLSSSHSRLYVHGIQYCPGYIEGIGYDNDGSEFTVISEEHVYDGTGICTFCGINQEAEYNEMEDYYEIKNYGQLLWFSDYVNSGNTSADAVLTDNITANEGVITEESADVNVWTPIGDFNNKYSGTFDGQGYIVSGLYFNDSNTRRVGLFGYTGASAEIENLGIVNSYIAGYSDVGGICGVNYGEITNCYNTGMICGSSNRTGGICGYNNGIILNCYNTGVIYGGSGTGGVCGQNYGTVKNCYSSGKVSGSAATGIGGVCGNNAADGVTNCYYLEGSADRGIGRGSIYDGHADVKTTEEFASGQVCYLLNESVSGGEIWYQTLGADELPVLDSDHSELYAHGTKYCPDYVEGMGYNNEGIDFVIVSEKHNYNNDGMCVYCDDPQEPLYNEKNGFYEISNYGELLWLANHVNNGNVSANAVLVNDITANKGIITEESSNVYIWVPIGNSTNKYTGTFDGQNYTVSGLYVNDATMDYAGLFGYAGTGAEIKNAGLINSYISGNSYIGGLCGCNEGIITNCYNSGEIIGNGINVGGVCGRNSSGTLTNCYNTGIVSGNSVVGGICGYNYLSSSVISCYNTGEVTGSGNNTGGICGSISSSAITKYCYNTGTVRSSGDNIGGICGYNSYSELISCYNTGEVTGERYVGEICGYNRDVVSNCYYVTGSSNMGIGSGTYGEVFEKTVEEFASGQVCWLLNGEKDTDVIFYQTIRKDTAPNLNNENGVVHHEGIYYYNSIISGDVNGDGIVNQIDAAIILKYNSGIISEYEFQSNYIMSASDYNEDGKTDIFDVIDILSYNKAAS